MELEEMNRTVIEEFRTNKGEVGGNFEGMPLLLITTTGAKTGLARTKPLAYLHADDCYYVIASFAGAEQNPPWFANLVANPRLEVEVGAEKFSATAQVIDEPKRSEIYAEVVTIMPVFAEYQSKTKRVIPVVALKRV